MTKKEIIKLMLENKSLRVFTRYNAVYDNYESISFEDILKIISQKQAKIEALEMDNEQLQNDAITVNLNFEALNLLVAEQKRENKRLITLSELGKMRANDYRVMRDRALKAEKDVERLKKLLDEAEARETEAAKRFYKEGMKDLAHRLQEKLDKIP